MKRFTTLFAVLAIGWSTSALAANDELKAMPGYVDFEKELMLGDATPTVEINLPAPMLKFIAGAAGATNAVDQETTQALSIIEHIRIMVVPFDPEHADRVASDVVKLADKLKRDQWYPIVHVREEPEVVNIYSRLDGDKMAGLAVIVTDGQELVFINIVGEMDPARIGSIIGMVSGGEGVDPEFLQNLGEGAAGIPGAAEDDSVSK